MIVEPVQGEGGIHMSSQAFLEGLRELCDEAGALLIFDEIQCGLGRTGKLWAHEYFGVQPDMMTLAKPLAGAHPSNPPTIGPEKVPLLVTLAGWRWGRIFMQSHSAVTSGSSHHHCMDYLGFSVAEALGNA